jgi:hypothetical protein
MNSLKQKTKKLKTFVTMGLFFSARFTEMRHKMLKVGSFD